MVEKLYTHHRPWLLGWCRALTRDPALSEDLVQDAFLQAMQNLELLSSLSDSQVRSWLTKTAKNRFYDLCRRAKLGREQEKAEEGKDDDLSRVAVASLLSGLEPVDRALFTMRYFQGYNATELGEMFSMPPSSVRSRLRNARLTLQKLYLQE